jgi:hypothetical protein
MNTRLSNTRGLSLIEVTIMLLVLMLLTGVLAPSIMDYVKDAQWVKVKEDCEAIGVSVVRLTRDIGPCLKFDGTGRCTTANRVDILYSDGPDVTAADLTDDATTSFNSAGNIAASMTWSNDTDRGDSMERQFTTNDANYLSPANFGNYNAVGPMFGLGWRGAYLSAPIGPDPWGHRYLVNSVFLSVANNARPGTGEGQRSGGWSNDSFCISAGPNGLLQTALGGNAAYGVSRRGDDFLFIISGDTR